MEKLLTHSVEHVQSSVTFTRKSLMLFLVCLLMLPTRNVRADGGAAMLGSLAILTGIYIVFGASESPEEKMRKQFFDAAKYNHLEQMKAALQDESIKKAINQLDSSNNTALYYASRAGNLHIVEALIAAKALVNVKTDRGITPIITASSNGHMAVARSLVAAGADVHARDDYGDNAVVAAAKWHSDTARYLLDEAGARLEDLEKKRLDSERINDFYCKYVTEKYVAKKNGKLSIEA